jgi:hypothetical protein
MFEWFNSSQGAHVEELKAKHERQLEEIQAKHERELEELKALNEAKYNELREECVKEIAHIVSENKHMMLEKDVNHKEKMENVYNDVDSIVNAEVVAIRIDCNEQVAESNRQMKRSRSEADESNTLAKRFRAANMGLFMHCMKITSRLRDFEAAVKHSR